MSLSNKNVLVTGGAEGIGKALVLDLLQKGASKIVVLDVAKIKAPALVADKIKFIKTDVTDVEQVRRSFREAVAAVGHLDIVVANAGICNENEPLKTVHVNLIGVMNTNYAAIEFMCKSNGGRGGLVINIASILGLDPIYCAPSYVATKHGVVGFTRCLGDEYFFKKHGIKFIAICPGYTETSLDIISKDQKQFELLCSQMGSQKPEAVSTSVATIAGGGDIKNGSVYMINKGITSEIKMSTYWKNF